MGFGGIISGSETVSRAELKMRQLLRDSVRFRASLVSETAVKVYEWADSVLVAGLDTRLNCVSVKQIDNPASDLTACIAEGLLGEQPKLSREILSKSLQETLFYCTGADPDLNYSQLKAKLMNFLRRRGASTLVRRFVAQSLFNFTWLQIGESFRAVAPTTAAFERDMYEVERLCRRIVASSWRTYNLMKRPFEPNVVDRLVCTIEQRLCNGE